MKYDVTIVGAGPAGSTAAKYLAERGLKTLLLDKETFPRDKPCGGGLPIRVLQRFPYVVNENIIESYSSSGTTFSPSLRYRVEAQTTTPLIATVLRRTFDAALVKCATDAGAVFQAHTPVSAIHITDEIAQVMTKQGETVESDVIIGADGVSSIVAKKSGLQKTGIEKGVCLMQEFHVPEPTMDEYFKSSRHCYVHSRFKTLTGYGWVFPKKEHLNIGFGVIQAFKQDQNHKVNLREAYKEYIAFLQETNLVPKNLQDAPLKGGALPTHPLEHTYADRLLLVGDAAGFINPLSGEGIYYAMVSGEIAAGVIAEAFQKRQFGREFLSRYQTRWQKEFGRDIDLISAVVKRNTTQRAEQVLKIASTDPILTNLIIRVITGELSVQEYKWKIIRRYFISSLKYRFHRTKDVP
ncbi:MAG: NAD(P)/FAD-dependent oxidoreductase [Candidatus Thermoplasmatota archaeon]|nr:NAD(P)/FAD-dependent oxidoreductase [Candidatus Thermoplasmatota archaeon]